MFLSQSITYLTRMGVALGAATLGALTHANTVQVAVVDAAGKPLADAVVFLDSAEARKLVKPSVGAEMAQEKKQFVPDVLVVPVGSPRKAAFSTETESSSPIRWKGRHIEPYQPDGSTSKPYCLKQALAYSFGALKVTKTP